MTKSIRLTTPIPKNIDGNEADLFIKFKHSLIKIPEIETHKNVFITHEGLALKNGLLLKGCAFNLWGKEDNTFYYTFWRDTIEKYAVCKWGKSLKSIHIEEPCILIHSKWFNYSFWVNGFLPRLIMAEENGWLKNAKLLVPEGWKKIPYVWESLKAFECNMEIIPEGYHVFANNLILPQTRQWTSSFYPELIKKTRRRMIAEAEKRIPNFDNYPKKIYLTRLKRGVRCVENETEVIELLQKHDFTPYQFEDLSIWEQIMLMNHASHFISIHGAGFSNIMFMKPGSSVIELINKPYAQLEYTFPFWKLSESVDLNYSPILCDAIGMENTILKYGKKNHVNELLYLVNKNILVNINSLEIILYNQLVDNK